MNKKLRVDPIACDGHGLCAELFPERIRLDDWGFPILAGVPRMIEGKMLADLIPTFDTINMIGGEVEQ